MVWYVVVNFSRNTGAVKLSKMVMKSKHPGQPADTPTRGLDISRTGQLVDWTICRLDKSRTGQLAVSDLTDRVRSQI